MQNRKRNNQEQFLREGQNMSSRMYIIRIAFDTQRDIHSKREKKTIGMYTYIA